MKKHSFSEWFMATRPWSFPASAMPVIVTLAYLYWMQQDVNWLIGICALANIVVFHAAGNTWSDYFDFKKGVDREDTIGGMSIVTGQFQAKEIRTLAIILLIVAIAGGVIITIYTGLPTLYIGLAGFILTVLYPFLKYNALGDADIFLTYSVLPILGTSYVAAGTFHPEVLWLSIPIGLITVGILHINNTRDTEHDKRAKIKTFAMLIGGKTSAYLYCFEILFPFIWILGGIVCGIFPLMSILVIIAIKPAIDNAKKALRYPQEGINAILGVDEMTAKLQLVFSLLLAVSLFMAQAIGTITL